MDEKSGYPPANAPPGAGYPPAQGYPPPAQGYPPPGQDYPPPAQGYPPPAQGYPPPAEGYPVTNQPPPAYGAPPPAQPTNVTVISSNNVVTGVVRYHESPVRTTCQYCHQEIVTNVHFSTGMLTWLAAGGICLIGCWAGCCLIPFCVDFCKDVEHECPACHQIVGVYRRIS